MKVFSFLTKYMRSYTYVITEGRHAFLVDPCEMEDVKMVLNGRIPEFAFLTHEHYDHVSGIEWARGQGVKIIASEDCNRNLADVKLNHSKYYGAFCAAQERLRGDPIPEVKPFVTHADVLFQDEMTMQWFEHELFFKKLPGHSSGGACLLVDHEIMFSGDTIFRDLPSNPDLMCGSLSDLNQSVAWILSQSPDILIYPGHYEPFTIQERIEKEL